jgi:hypothetical protein
MILPNKHISTHNSLLGIGAIVIEHMDSPRTVSSLWNQLSQDPKIVTFERFILALDLLYIIGAIEIEEGLLRKCCND